MDKQYEIYWVCFPLRDSMDSLHGDLAVARREYFQKGRKPVRVYKERALCGFDGQVRGKLSVGGIYWKKRVKGFGRPVLEEAFSQRDGWVVVVRDFRGAIVSRIYFDRGHVWQRSEYYEPWDASTARVIFRPDSQEGAIQRWDWDPEKKAYRALSLYPTPYRFGSAEQSLVDARLGTPQLLLLTSSGELGFCSQKESQARLEAMEEVSTGTMVLMPAWEVKEGELVDGGEPAITFPSLEEYAKIQPPAQEESTPLIEAGDSDGLSEPVEDFSPGEEDVLPPQMQAALSEAGEAVRALLQDSGLEEPGKEEEASTPATEIQPEKGDALPPAQEAKGSAQPPQKTSKEPDSLPMEAESAPEPGPESQPGEGLEAILAEAAAKASGELELPGYTGGIRGGKASGRGRAQQPGGATSYEGEYLDGKRHGFGSYYYKDGNLCYAGSWKEDRRDGLGVSFRDSDHALHVANWQEGQPQGLVTLFDSEGNLRYSGRMENGKKEGAGVVINGKDGTVFVGQWSGGEATGLGSAFDRDGRLLYYGGWKDGKRHGHGTEFDQTGGVVFDGEFRDGNYYNGVLYQKLQNP
ncbi:hypothetical protein D7X94_03185 [Acutalibacter sp. 1XD8-33]|uniref:hypothetical protein n=1 Tax=Acutalibacter sp. 1XD8-33 TaxID=2320081 RepID=UPI000EA2750D|nr:hypothetical protein [Acutalibacter sp. 1XD8-33]RKJ41309.1 hypothetical protein D7X94_03185 [Acutalibacter sp. 1XD8-33]